MIAARALSVSALFLVASVVLAQTPAPSAPPAQPAQNPGTQPVQAPPVPTLGRMFYTPAERAALDEMRRRPPVAVAVQEEKPPQPPAPEYVTLNGVVRRNDGTTTVWLNNKPVQGQKSSEGLIVTPATRASTPGNVTVVVPQSGRRIDLKVGQQLEVTSGKVQEAYRTPPPAAATETAPPADAAPERSAQRRPAREREMLRDLLREIDGPAGNERSEPAPAASAAAR